jgi:pyrimidine deaminase RibD-like protein
MQIDLDEVFEVAHKTAMKSPCRFKVSCILVDKRGRLVAKGHNHWSTGNKMGRRTVHVESRP